MVKIVRRVADILSSVRPMRRARFAPGSDVEVGEHVHIGRNVVFRSKRVRIGDGTVIKDNVTVESEVFEIGDYGTIYSGCFFPGPGELRIGHNFWLGNDAIVDAKGGTTIGNNVGVGAGSQLWTHMEFGDVMFGCRFQSDRPLTIGDDVWLVGHCLVSPVTIGDKSLAMLGSLITKDMEPNHCYAGSPAKDLTAKLGPQYEETTVAQRREYVERELDAFCAEAERRDRDQFVVVDSMAELEKVPAGKTVFDVESRRYRKIGSELESRCMRWLLLHRAKFVPVG
jgi:acetyltransferase-like isoleucine patch superfamily enzyme